MKRLKRLGIWFVAAAAATIAAAAEPGGQNRGGGFAWGEETPAPKVAETGRLIVVDDPARDNFKDTPRGVQAARMTVPHRVFDWRPSPDPNRVTGGAWLPGAALSPDESAVAVLERVGSPTGPWGSRIPVFNLHNNQIVNVLNLPRTRLETIRFTPDGAALIALESGQEAVKSKTRFLRLHPKSGKVLASSPPLPENPTSWVISGDRLYCKLTGETELRIYDLNDLAAAPETFGTRGPGGVLAASANGSTLAQATAGLVEFLAIDGVRPEPRRTARFSPDFVPERMVPTLEDGEAVLLISAGGDAALSYRDAFRPVTAGATGVVDWNVSNRFTLLGGKKNNLLQVYRLPGETTPAYEPINPGKSAPPTRGEFLFARLLTGPEPRVLALDHRGNLMIFELQKRRWSKRIVFANEKLRGMR